MITVAEYEAGTTETAIYPEVGSGFYAALRYVGHGLTGEIGEISEKIKKVYRDEEGVLTDEKVRDLVLECGDVLWYLTRASVEHGTSLAETLQTDTPDDGFDNMNFNWHKEDTPTDPDYTVLDWASYYVSGMAEWNGAYIGELRSYDYLTSSDAAQFDLSCIAHNLNELLVLLGSSMGEAAQINHNKLFSRKDRGVIGGSGDNR